uniref:Uncharacterized protein n=1 Tax=Glossina austeni TaxID=7395 RepID=A0A1A9UR57_GLOAU
MSFIQFDNVCQIPEEDEEEYEDEDFTISIQELPMDLPEIERIILPPRDEGEPEKQESFNSKLLTVSMAEVPNLRLNFVADFCAVQKKEIQNFKAWINGKISKI